MPEADKIALATVRLLALTLFATYSAFSQSQNNVIEWMKDPFGDDTEKIERQLEPLEIIEIKAVTVDHKSITLGKHFTAGNDWIKRIGFRVRNASPQLVASIQIHVYLPQFKRPYIVYCYGCAKGEKALQPGEEATVRALLFHDWARDIVTRQGGDISMIRTAAIRDIQVYRPDGTMYICVMTKDQKSVCGSPSP